MQLTALSLALTRVGLGGFAPSSLFLYGEQGAWYDPSDIDRYTSQLGPELVTNGDFSNGTTGWSANNSGVLSSAAGVATITNGGAAVGRGSQAVPTTIGTWYKVTATFSNPAGGSPGGQLYAGTTTGAFDIAFTAATTGPAVMSFRATTATTSISFVAGIATLGASVQVDNISVRELTAIDTATMFQDSAGTTPVTAVEQPVGLILDKSKGLVLGSEVFDPTWLNSSTGWTIGGGVTIASGAYTNTGTSGDTFRSVTGINPATWYEVTLTVTRTSGSLAVLCGNVLTSSPSISASGTYKLRILNSSAASNLFVLRSSVFSGTVTNISVRELPGNHAFQTTTTSRPVLSARYNLLTKTELFNDTSGWPKTIAGTGTTPVVTDAYIGATAPDGTLTASRLQASISGATSGDISGLQRGSGSTVSTLSGSLWVKSNTSSTQTAWFRAGGAERSISVTTSWTQITDTGTTAYFSIGLRGAISGAGTLDILIWHPIQVPANQASLPYQRVNTSTDYDADPAKFPVYLRFDGVDDWLQTNSIDFTSTDKMTVFAGVRKLSDAAGAVVTELSANLNSNNGAFVLSAPFGTVPPSAYGFRSKGTAAADAGATSSPVAPTTDVLTGIGNISDDQAILRVDGTQVASSTADQGTGNYGNYPLYIGRRGGTTLPFNGQIYSLIVRGAQTSTTQIAQTERWVAGKTGVTL